VRKNQIRQGPHCQAVNDNNRTIRKPGETSSQTLPRTFITSRELAFKIVDVNLPITTSKSLNNPRIVDITTSPLIQ
jgi:hypothetical protein